MNLPRISLCLIPLTFACATAVKPTPIAYEPQGSRLSNPAEVAKAIIVSNTVQGCVTDPSVNEVMLVVKFVCSNGVGNAVARFDRVQSIQLDQSGEWYRVSVKHRGGSEDFTWTSKSLEDMQRLADALAALSTPANSAKPADSDAMKL